MLLAWSLMNASLGSHSPRDHFVLQYRALPEPDLGDVHGSCRDLV